VPTNLSIELCRSAVRTNYFPLWEAEEGMFRLTHEVKKPKPISEYTKLINKFSHLREDELERIQEEVNSEYDFLHYLTEYRK
jgi:pyruvate/2-oxoacid:ferredoxin oxidoreductase beta subunit